MRVLDWLAAKDPGYLALRRAVRGAIVVPTSLALTIGVVGNPGMATFAVFSSFALLILVDIPGPLVQRLTNYFLLALACAVLIVPATVFSQHVWTATLSMAIVGFAIVFLGVVSSVLVASTTALLLAWILPVTTAGSVGQIPERLAGWGIGSGLSLIALAVVWPAPDSDPLRRKAGDACHALADRIRAQAVAARSPAATAGAEAPDVVAAAKAATAELATSFRRTTYRPATLTTGGRAVVRLVDELDWVSVIAGQYRSTVDDAGTASEVAAVWHAAATVLERCAVVLRGDDRHGAAARTELGAALDQLDARMETVRTSPTVRSQLRLTSCEPSFRGMELSYAARQVGRNTSLMAAADARPMVDRLLGRVPAGMTGPWQIAGIRARSHLNLRSAWLHNSLRSACALAIAVLIATSLGVQHAFWVVFGVLSVLRSTALNTGENALRALAGTALGFIVGGAIVAGIGTNPAVLWVLLPIAVVLAAFAPSAVSFLAGQAAFTTTIVILFNLIQPAGWRVGLVRVEDIAIGCAVSLAVGLLFWPRGAAAALGFALDAAYRSGARYLTRAIDVGLDGGREGGVRSEYLAAISASSRLDDAFRQYLAERGAKHVPLAEASSLVTGTVALRLAGDAVVELWRGIDGHTTRLAATGHEVSVSAAELERWYDELGSTLSEHRGAVPEPTSAADFGTDRWAAALASESDTVHEAAAVGVVWTADHLDAARRLQPRLVEAARMAAGGGGSWLT